MFVQVPAILEFEENFRKSQLQNDNLSKKSKFTGSCQIEKTTVKRQTTTRSLGNSIKQLT